jgi:hypothetical protein
MSSPCAVLVGYGTCWTTIRDCGNRERAPTATACQAVYRFITGGRAARGNGRTGVKLGGKRGGARCSSAAAVQ